MLVRSAFFTALCCVICFSTASAQTSPNTKSGVTFGGGVPAGGNPGPALPSSPHIPQNIGPGSTGQSGVTFGGGIPGGQDPGRTTPSTPSKRK
jgi:hypothetical protein